MILTKVPHPGCASCFGVLLEHGGRNLHGDAFAPCRGHPGVTLSPVILVARTADSATTSPALAPKPGLRCAAPEAPKQEAAAPAPEAPQAKQAGSVGTDVAAPGAISAKLVQQLRQSSGAGMMDCKKALIEAKGDADVASEVRGWRMESWIATPV